MHNTHFPEISTLAQRIADLSSRAHDDTEFALSTHMPLQVSPSSCTFTYPQTNTAVPPSVLQVLLENKQISPCLSYISANLYLHRSQQETCWFSLRECFSQIIAFPLPPVGVQNTLTIQLLSQDADTQSSSILFAILRYSTISFLFAFFLSLSYFC